MPRDYRETVRALRAKAADKAVGSAEARLLLDKAKELEDKHLPRNSNPTTEKPTITDRSGHTGSSFDDWFVQWQAQQDFARWIYEHRSQAQKDAEEATRRASYEESVRQTQKLWEQQHQWNKPPDGPDPDDLISEEYKTNTAHAFHTTDDEDYGYDEWIKGGYDAE